MNWKQNLVIDLLKNSFGASKVVRPFDQLGSTTVDGLWKQIILML